MSSVLNTSQLSKNYGSISAVSDLDLTVEEGQVFGLLGPNGSGKTSTLGMVLGVINAAAGEYQWFGEAPSPDNRKRIGAILEKPSFYPYLSAKDNLKIASMIKGIDKKRIDEVLKEVDLLDRKNSKFETYSLGMKQRLSIAAALLADPQVMVLDEPTNGLDPQGIAEVRELIQMIASKGKTIILASHLLDEVQKVCTHFAVLDKGKKLFQGSLADAMGGQSIIEVGASDMAGLKAIVEELSGVRNVTLAGSFYRLDIEPEVTMEYVTKNLVEKGITPTHLKRNEGSLEQEFLKILDQNA